MGWILFFVILGVVLKNNVLYNVTINKSLAFSYPFDMQVYNIFINEQYSLDTIETTLPLSRSNIKKFSNFTSLEGKFSFEYPSVFSLSQQEFSGSEILYHIDFKSKTNSIKGFVQVWNLQYPLEEFLAQSKSTSQLNFKDFDSKPVNVNGLSGYFWDYSLISGSGSNIKGNEVFLQRDKTMYRISYFVPQELWTQEQEDTYKKIVNSFKVLNNTVFIDPKTLLASIGFKLTVINLYKRFGHPYTISPTIFSFV
jgi:hypothetical protein